jgi:hypothetical protein
MKTYSETKGEKKFNWFGALKELPTEDVASELADKAGNWVTCATGNQCSIIPRDEDDQPIDEKLNQLGLDFAEDVDTMYHNIIYGDSSAANKSRRNAIRILRRIEKRSAYLIQLELKNAKKLLVSFGVIKERKRK